MKKYSFSIKEISSWYDSKREPFKKRGEFKSLLKKYKVDKNDLLAYSLNRENGDWIILREFNSLEERKAYHQIQKEHEKIVSIRHSLLSIQEQEEKLKKSHTMDDYEEKEITLNSLYDKALNGWQELKEQTKNEFYSDIIQKLINENWVNPLMYVGKIEGKNFYTKNPFAKGGILDKIDKQPEKKNKIIKAEKGKAFYEMFTKTKIADKLKERGMVLNPTHNSKLLKEVRAKLYQEDKITFKNQRKENGLTTTNQDLMSFEKLWFENELSVVEEWLENENNSAITVIELEKYLSYVKGKITGDISKPVSVEKLSIQKYLSEIENLPDIEIPFEGKPFKNENPQMSGALYTIPIERTKAKDLLKRFLLECQDKFTEGKTVCLNWLDKMQAHWKAQKISAIRQFQAKSDSRNSEKLEKQRSDLLRFFFTQNKLIEQLKNDIISQSFLPTTEPSELNELQQTENLENKLWHSIPLPKIAEHFQILKETKNEKGEPLLSEQQFQSFIKRGFLNYDNEPKQIINYFGVPKQEVIRIFFEFYQLGVTYGNSKRHKKYIDLIFYCFNNWNDNEDERRKIKRLFKQRI